MTHWYEAIFLELKFTSALEGARFGVSKWPGLVGFQILLCNLLIHFKDYDEGKGFYDSWSMMTHDESLFITKVEHGKPIKSY